MENENQFSTLTGFLPPLPKSLTTAINATNTLSFNQYQLQYQQHFQIDAVNNDFMVNASGSSMTVTNRQHSNGHKHSSLSSTQESLSDRESLNSRSSNHSGHYYHHQRQLHATVNNKSTNTYHNSNLSNINIRQSQMQRIDNDSTVPKTSVSNASSTSNNTVTSTTKLDTQLAILRREMYSLRQLDLSLLSQLWALNESIQGFRVYLQEQEALSPPSPSPTASETNSLTSEVEDDSYCGQSTQKIIHPSQKMLVEKKSTTSTSSQSGSSSATSSMGKHYDNTLSTTSTIVSSPGPLPAIAKSHPQLPRILQQRMRRAPPPPPLPNRPKSSALITTISSSNTTKGTAKIGAGTNLHSKSESSSPSSGTQVITQTPIMNTNNIIVSQ